MFELPDKVIRELEELAVEERMTPERLIERLVAEQVQRHSRELKTKRQVRLPLIPIAETGPIGMVSGSDLDDIFAREDLAS